MNHSNKSKKKKKKKKKKKNQSNIRELMVEALPSGSFLFLEINMSHGKSPLSK